LLYAGDSTSTIGNPIADVLNALKDTANPPHVPTIVGGSQHTVMACTGFASQPGPGGLSAAVPQRLEDAEVELAVTAKNSHVDALMKDPAVLGVGVGASDAPGKAAIIVFVEKGKPHGAIPLMLDGVPTKVRSVDRFRAFGTVESCPVKSPETRRSAPRQAEASGVSCLR
jgi:hypothetical protein